MADETGPVGPGKAVGTPAAICKSTKLTPAWKISEIPNSFQAKGTYAPKGDFVP
jgi:hypothetical protein